MRINPVITALGLLGLFAASMLVGYVGGQAFLAPAKSAPQPPRASTPTPVAAEPPAQPAPPLGATRQPTISSTPTPPAPTQSAPTSSPSAAVTPSKPAPSAAQSQPVTVGFRVQVGAFRRKENADARMAQLKQDGYDPYIVTSGDLFRVIVGAFTDRENAIRLQEELHARGYDVLVLTVR